MSRLCDDFYVFDKNSRSIRSFSLSTSLWRIFCAFVMHLMLSLTLCHVQCSCDVFVAWFFIDYETMFLLWFLCLEMEDAVLLLWLFFNLSCTFSLIFLLFKQSSKFLQSLPVIPRISQKVSNFFKMWELGLKMKRLLKNLKTFKSCRS